MKIVTLICGAVSVSIWPGLIVSKIYLFCLSTPVSHLPKPAKLELDLPELC